MREILCAAMAVCIFSTTLISQARNTPAQPSAQPTARSPVTPTPPVIDTDYVIGEEDTVEVRVWKEPDFESKGVVRPDGKISVPGLGDVHASGYTPKQLAERITQGLGRFFTEEPPLVTVHVPEVRSKMVHTTGDGIKNGPFSLGRPLTVFELISRAGGLTDFAKRKEIKIIRVEKGVTTRFNFNYDTYVEGQFQQNIPLKPGDIVYVP